MKRREIVSSGSGLILWALLAGLATAQTQVDLRTQGKSVDFAEATSTRPFKMGATLPVSCAIGETFFKTSAPSGQNFYTCTAANVWTLQGAGTVTHTQGALAEGLPVVGNGGGDVESAGKTGSGTEFVMSQSPTLVEPVIGSFVNAGHDHQSPAGGGLLSSSALASSAKQGNGTQFQMFGGGALTAGDCAQFDGAGNLVSAGAACGTSSGGEANTGENVGGGTFIWFKQKTGVTLQFKTFSASARIGVSEVNDVFNFDVNEAALSLANLGGSLPGAKLEAGVDAVKIGAGTVGNSQFGYLANVSSDLQGQLDGKAPLVHGHSAGGDLAGEVGNATVRKLQNWAVAAAAPASGQVLTWNATAGQWEPQLPANLVTSVFGRTGAVTAQTGDYAFSQIAGTVADSQIAAGVNATKVGAGSVDNTEFGYLNGVTSGLQTQINSKLGHAYGTVTNGASAASASGGDTLKFRVADNKLSISVTDNDATHGDNVLLGINEANLNLGSMGGAVSNGQVGSGIDAAKLGSGTVSNTELGYVDGVSAAIQGQLDGKAASVHGHSTGGDLTGDVGNATVTKLRNRAVTAAAPASGQVLTWNTTAGQWEPQTPASSLVTSVFGRTGAVTAQTGDYAFSQIAGTVADSQIAAGVNATKVGAGSVDNTEFGYLNGVTSGLQAQLDGKAAASHSHTTGGDLSGEVGNATVAKLRNRSVSTAAPSDGQALKWNAGANQWEPQNDSGGSSNATQIQGRDVASTAPSDGQALVWSAAANQWQPGTTAGGGAAQAAQLKDFAVTRLSATQLKINDGCASATPCNARFGNVSYRFESSSTLTLSAGSGTALLYLDSAGNLVAGHSGLTLTCTGCVVAGGVTAFPADAIPLFSWSAAAGAWDAGGLDQRAFLSAKRVTAGDGIATAEAAGQTTVSVDTAVVGLRVAVPATAASACNSGSWAADTSYFYICYATNTWRRAALSSW